MTATIVSCPSNAISVVMVRSDCPAKRIIQVPQIAEALATGSAWQAFAPVCVTGRALLRRLQPHSRPPLSGCRMRIRPAKGGPHTPREPASPARARRSNADTARRSATASAVCSPCL